MDFVKDFVMDFIIETICETFFLKRNLKKHLNEFQKELFLESHRITLEWAFHFFSGPSGTLKK